MIRKPRHDHDCPCKSCSFLGTSGQHDLYLCLNHGELVARFGSKGEEYRARTVDMARTLATLEPDHPCTEALKRAAAIGLV